MNIVIEEVSSVDFTTELQTETFLYHTNIWNEFITKSFSFKNDQQCFIIAKDQDTQEIKTVLPITKVKSIIFGNRIISTGYQEYGGMVGDQKFLSQILDFIKKKYQNEFQNLIINGSIDKENNPKNSTKINRYNIIKKESVKRFVLKLTDEETLWKNIQKSKRKAINKARKNCTCRELTIQDLNPLYKLYLQNMRRFGSPPYSKNYFSNFFQLIQKNNQGRVYGCFKENKLISALLGFTHNKTIHITTAISNPKFSSYRPSDLMHWEFISWATKNGFESFDFGVVREASGHFEYKRKWGGELSNLPTFYMNLKSKSIPEQLDPNSSKYKLAIKIWQHLPLKVTEWMGMRLRRELGI